MTAQSTVERIQSTYSDVTAYRDVFKHVDDIAFWLSTVKALDADRVVELGVGDGRIAIPLAKAGIEVVGIDLLPDMLDQARKRIGDELSAASADLIELLQADMRSFEMDSPVDAVLVTSLTFQHLTTLEDRRLCLEACRNALRPGGHLVIDVFFPNYEILSEASTNAPKIRRYVTSQTTDGDLTIRYDASTYSSSTQTLTVQSTVETYRHGELGRKFIFENVGHIFFPSELEVMLENSGFECKGMLGDHAANPLSDSASRLIAVARKQTEGDDAR